MSESERPPEEQNQSAAQPDAPPDRPSSQPPPGQLDWRLVAIVAVAVLFLLAIYFNKKYYGQRELSRQDNRPVPATTPDTDAARQRPPISRAEWYARLVQNAEFRAMDTIFTADDKLFAVARPRSIVPDRENPKRIAGFQAGRLFDITKRLEGVRPERLFRREMPGGKGLAFMDTFPPIGVNGLEMVCITAAEAADDVKDAQPVIGLQVADETRAYPLALANYHDVINDTLRGKPIVVAWTAVAIAPSALERTLPDGSVAVFGSAGILYQGGIVLYDTDTHSLWSPFLHTCITGERTGTLLRPIQAVVTTWQAWKRLHPETTVFAGTKPPLKLDYKANPAVPSRDYYTNQSALYPTDGFDPTGTPMPPKVQVFGITGPDGKAAKAYEISCVRRSEGAIEDTVGGKSVTLTLDLESQILTAQDAEGKPLLVETMFWFCWAGLHPDTEVWQEAELREMYNLRGEAPAQTGETPAGEKPSGSRQPAQR